MAFRHEGTLGSPPPSWPLCFLSMVARFDPFHESTGHLCLTLCCTCETQSKARMSTLLAPLLEVLHSERSGQVAARGAGTKLIGP